MTWLTEAKKEKKKFKQNSSTKILDSLRSEEKSLCTDISRELITLKMKNLLWSRIMRDRCPLQKIVSRDIMKCSVKLTSRVQPFLDNSTRNLRKLALTSITSSQPGEPSSGI